MNRVTKMSILAATFLTMALSPLAQAQAVSFQGAMQHYSYGQGAYGGDVEQVRHKGRHHYNRHHRHKGKRYCRYSHRRGGMVCRPHHRSRW